MEKLIPLSIITGYNRSGKTTFIRQLVEKRKDKKFAIIENDPSSVFINHDIVSRPGQGIYEMENGFLYCKLKEELFQTMYDLVDHEYDFNHLLIELPGEADPSSLVYSLLTDCCVQKKFRLDAVISVVDVSDIDQLLKREMIAGKQIALSDIVVLNPGKEGSFANIFRVADWITRLNPSAYYVDIDESVDPTHCTLDRLALQTRSILEDTSRVPEGHCYHSDHIDSYCFQTEGCIDLDLLSQWLNELLMFSQQDIYGIKGVLNARHSDHKIVLQSIRENFIWIEGEPWRFGEERLNKVYITGRNLEPQILESNLHLCLEKSLMDSPRYGGF